MSDENSREFGEEDLSEEESKSESDSESEEDDELSSENEFGVEEECLSDDNGRGTTSLSSNKEMSIDRISALPPDSLLIHILSFLYIEKAASTCVLAKRWQFLWTELSKLEFCDISRWDDEESQRIFVSMVHSALASHSGNNLQTFGVSLYYDKSVVSYINVWVDFIVKKMVKEVSLCLLYYQQENEYRLPQMVYSNSSLTFLSLEGCIFYPKGKIMWTSLTTLYLCDMEILECDIKKILVGCPALVSLSLMKCWGFSCLEIHSHSVRTLRVEDYDYNEEALLEIFAPYVNLLDISVCLVGKKFRLRNISSVLTAKFDVTGVLGDEDFVGLLSYTKDLFVSLQHIKKLNLGSGAIKVLAMLVQFPQSRQRECLIIEAQKDEGSISGILTMLEFSPNLETLVIKGEICLLRELIRLHPPAKSDLDCDLLHLKTVNITNLALEGDGVPMLKLAQILLNRATVLEKMVIKDYQISSKISPYEVIDVALTLLSYPRSSQKAVVLLRDDSYRIL